MVGKSIMKKNKLYYFNIHYPECHFFCMFSDICSYLYDEEYNVYLSWTNTKYDKSNYNSLDYILKQEYPKNYDIIEYAQDIKTFKPIVKKYFDSKPSTRPENVEEFNRLFWNRFKLSDKLNSIIDDTTDKFKNYKTLAVHIRRSDILKLTYFMPFIRFNPNDLSQYYHIINDVFISGGYEKIFLCTEDKVVFDYIIDKFPKDVIISNDVYRSSNEVINNLVTQEGMYSLNREQNGEKLLLEIMSDMMIASKCDGFLGTVFSGFSMFIEIFNNNKFKEINYF